MSLHLTGLSTLAIACDRCPERILRRIGDELTIIDVIEAEAHAHRVGWALATNTVGRLEHRCPRCAS